MVSAFQLAASETLPKRNNQANRSWISIVTLDLIEQRTEARLCVAWNVEKILHQRIKASVKTDKHKWLNGIVMMEAGLVCGL